MASSEGRRKWLWGFLIAIVIGTPIALLSDWGLARVTAYVAENPQKDWAPDVQAWVAAAYAWTMRPEKAIHAYEYAATLYQDHNDQNAALDARLQAAIETEELPNGKYLAAPLYEDLANNYPETPAGKEAKGAVMRIRTMSRP
jgi:hypothetical protein